MFKSMKAVMQLSDAQAELLAGGWGGYQFKSYSFTTTKISQQNNAINAAVGLAVCAKDVVNAASIANTQINSVG
jgi:hypothetical protein